MPTIQERIRNRLEIGLLPQLAYKIEISPKDKEAILILAGKLLKNKGLSYILYFNHISFNDPWLAGFVARQIDSKQARPIIVPASFSHTSPKDNKNSAFPFLAGEAGRCGIDLIRIIQTYQVENPKFGFTQEQAWATYRALITKLRAIRDSQIAVGCIISPEGHRSENGKLGFGKPGIIHIGEILAPTVYIPLGIVYFGDYNRNGINIGKRISLRIGETILHEGKKCPSVDQLMANLAAILPAEVYLV